MRFDRAALLLSALIAVIAVLRFEGPAVGYWDTYVTAPALHAAGTGIDFVLRDGSPLLEYELGEGIPADLVDLDTFGIITKDQRLGAGVVASPWFTLFGLAGFRLLHGLLWGLIALGGCLLGRAVFGTKGIALCVGALLCLQPYAWAANRLNPNVFALAASVVILAILARRRPAGARAYGAAAVVGLLYGAAGNVRPELVVAAPAVLWGLLGLGGHTDHPANHLRRLGLFAGCALLAVSPTLLWNGYAFGDALVHSSQYGDFEGFRPTFPHRFLGATFEFNGLLNWPFHDTVVRTPHFPLPIFLLVPAQMVLCWGSGLLALAVLGARALGAGRHGVLLGLWFAMMFTLLLPHENWDELKMTYALLYTPPLAVWVVAGGARFWDALQRTEWTTVGSTVAVLLTISFVAWSLRAVHTPLDARWYVRFPGAAANGSGIALLTDEPRRGWELFHTRETPEEIAIERARYTRGNILPHPYWEAEPDWSVGAETLQAELGQRELRLLAVWYYIYGGRRDDVTSDR
ncbi:MAG: hypothetical protein KDA24_23510 [Deltaproteobacteria bacterium]|nr:hypothetical protein [Deltaproteobacteria bacterium]